VLFYTHCSSTERETPDQVGVGEGSLRVLNIDNQHSASNQGRAGNLYTRGPRSDGCLVCPSAMPSGSVRLSPGASRLPVSAARRVARPSRLRGARRVLCVAACACGLSIVISGVSRPWV